MGRNNMQSRLWLLVVVCILATWMVSAIYAEDENEPKGTPEDVQALRQQVAGLSDSIQRLEESNRGLKEALDEHRTHSTAAADDLSTRLGDLATRLQSLEQDSEELKETDEQLGERIDAVRQFGHVRFARININRFNHSADDTGENAEGNRTLSVADIVNSYNAHKPDGTKDDLGNNDGLPAGEGKTYRAIGAWTSVAGTVNNITGFNHMEARVINEGKDVSVRVTNGGGERRRIRFWVYIAYVMEDA